MTEKRILAFILVSFVALGSIYALATPVFEASDELWHYPLVRHLADGNPLPVQPFDPAEAGPWKQEASQPPLYYYLGAALTFWIDTTDMGHIRWLNPHVDTGVITADGNINLVVHDPKADPWQGTQLAVRIVRIFSVFLGGATVFLTFLIGKEVVSDRPEVALGAAAVTAYTPMFLFISGSVNNDNLVIPLASLSLLLMVRLVKRAGPGWPVEWPYLVAIGVTIGLGALTKITAVGLLILALGTVWMKRWRDQDRPLSWRLLGQITWQAAGRFLLIVLPVLVIAGWWYLRNIRLYGDWSGWNAFIAVLGQRAHPAGLAQLWDERWGFMLSYWGLFGGLNVPMSEWIYRLLNGLVVLSVVGFGYYGVRVAIGGWRRHGRTEGAERGAWLWAARTLRLIEEQFGLVICLLWALAVVVGLIRWATVTWSSQGRLVFSAISALNILFVLGLVGWMPRRPATAVTTLLGLGLLILSMAAPFVWVGPAYRLPSTPTIAEFRPVDVRYGDQMRLVAYRLEDKALRPGDWLDVWLAWEALGPMNRDWSVFVHLNDPVLGSPIAQRDMYPAQGLLATRLLEPGQEWVGHYRLQLPPTAVAPAELTLTAGLYDYETGERLVVEGGGDATKLAELALQPLPGEVPNPVAVNFEGDLELAGFMIEPRRVNPSDTIRLTLYWKALRTLSRDYTLFAQVVDEQTTRWASQDLGQPTSGWLPGELQAVTLDLPLAGDTPPSVYPLIVGVYTRTPEGGFDRLQMVTDEGRLTDDFLVLAPIRVD